MKETKWSAATPAAGKKLAEGKPFCNEKTGCACGAAKKSKPEKPAKAVFEPPETGAGSNCN